MIPLAAALAAATAAAGLALLVLGLVLAVYLAERRERRRERAELDRLLRDTSGALDALRDRAREYPNHGLAPAREHRATRAAERAIERR